MSVKYQSNGLPLSPVHSDEMLGNDTRSNEGATNLRVERGGGERERKKSRGARNSFRSRRPKRRGGYGIGQSFFVSPQS